MSTITRERAQQIFLGNGPEPTASEERELARIVLASLELERGMIRRFDLDMSDCDSCGQDCGADMVEDLDGEYVLWDEVLPHLYRYDEYTAHPAPVSVPDERCQHLSELYHAQEKRLFKLAQRIKGPSFDKYAYSPSQAIDVLESAIFDDREDDCRAAMLQGAESNSPVIPECSCHACRPVTFADSRFVACPECGNKRCPHANDHRNACTGSNEPGQEGSAYPAAPQQEV